MKIKTETETNRQTKVLQKKNEKKKDEIISGAEANSNLV